MGYNSTDSVFGWEYGQSRNDETSPFLVPPLGHAVFAILLLSLWRFPRLAQAFDPKPMFPASNADVAVRSSPIETLTKARMVISKKVSSTKERDDDCDSDSIPSLDGSYNFVKIKNKNGNGNKNEDDNASFLESKAPQSTAAERTRFLVARDGNQEAALENLQKYLSWRQQYESLAHQQKEIICKQQCDNDDDDGDWMDWVIASQTAMAFQQEENAGKCILPRVVRTHKTVVDGHAEEARDLDGYRIFHVLPARIDDTICRLHTYAMAIGLYLDRKISRDSNEKVTITLDLRGGEGWRNILALKLIPFIKDIAKLLLTMFPERLHKIVLYPLPFALSWIFNTVKKVIDKKTAEKIFVLSGGADINSPLPLDQMANHVDRNVAMFCEKERLASFRSC